MKEIIAKNFLAMEGSIQYKGTYGPFENQYTPESYLNGKTTTNVGGEVTGYAYMIGNDSLPPEYSAMTVNVENTRLRSMLFDNTEAQTGMRSRRMSTGTVRQAGTALLSRTQSAHTEATGQSKSPVSSCFCRDSAYR